MNYYTIPGLRADSKIHVFNEKRYTVHKKLGDGSTTLRCTKGKAKDGGCKGPAKLDPTGTTCTDHKIHNQHDGLTDIAANEFRNDLKGGIVSRESNLLQIYDDLAKIYEITNIPEI